MTVLTTQVSSLARPRLPRWAPALVGAGSVAFAVLATTALVHLAGSASGVAGLAWPGAAVATGVVVAIWRGGLALPILTGMAVMWLSALLA